MNLIRGIIKLSKQHMARALDIHTKKMVLFWSFESFNIKKYEWG